MKVQVISLFPDAIKAYFDVGMMRKAQEQGQLQIGYVNLRDFGIGPRKTVDDIPFGGGNGMVLKPEPIVNAIEHALQNCPKAKVILPTPRGDTFRQSDAQGLADEGNDLIIVCARYEGYDERITDWVDEQISIGNYVLTGGELPATVIIDAVVRLLPDVLGGEQSAESESFADDQTKEAPHYTRPRKFRGKSVPEELLSGDHKKIEQWRQENSK